MSTWEVAFVEEQGVTFAVVVVKDHVLLNRADAAQVAEALALRLGCPAVLLGERRHQAYGRPDIVRFLQHVHLSQLRWRRVSLAA
jgi:hypothetical protein